MRDAFWRAENTLQSQIESPADVARLFAPLAADNPLRAEYSRAALAADGFIQLADANKTQNRMRPEVLYLGGLAKFSTGDNAGALQLLERLQAEYPDYKRDQYVNDRDNLNPEYSVPAAPGVSKLVFYLRLQVALKDAPDAFGALRQITQEALNTLAAQREYSRLVASRSDKYNTYYFQESSFGSQPDQLRAAALPSTPALVETAWDALIEKSLHPAGAQALREWLRGLSAPDAPLANAAIYRLATIDQLIIKQYFAQAQQLLNEKNFDGARASYRQIMAEYSGSDAADQAEAALPGIVPVAVAYYKEEGEKNFRAAEPNQFGVPQTKSREYFEKMYKEEPKGLHADEALYWWSRAVGTEGNAEQAIAQYEQLAKEFPESPFVPNALYASAFIYGANFNRQYDKAIGIMLRIVEQYPQSEKAPEALWTSAFWRAYGEQRYTDAAVFLEKLRQYPNFYAYKHIDEELAKYNNWIKEGKGL